VNTEERSQAIFGLFDGVVSLVGLVFGLIIAHASRHDFILTGLGAAISATVSMSTGEFEAAKGEMRARLSGATAMGIATMIGSLLPIVAFFWLPHGPALGISAALCLAAAAWVGYEKRKGLECQMHWYTGYASSFAFLLGAAGITLGIVSAIGGG
jgi:VIT1/CCC1 family predicted Fe2+/Mn2+ transporter